MSGALTAVLPKSITHEGDATGAGKARQKPRAGETKTLGFSSPEERKESERDGRGARGSERKERGRNKIRREEGWGRLKIRVD